MKVRIRILMGLMLLGLSGVTQAALFDRGGGMIYDDVLDITWLQDANQGGSMNWDDSVAWAGALEFGGFDDWRLASMDVNGDNTIINCNGASEVACRDNELGYMFYQNLMGSFFDDLTGDQGLFTNIQSNHWSGTEFAPNPSNALVYNFVGGDQFSVTKGNLYGAWAVRAGDVAVVPVPGAVWLLGSGLLGLAGLRRGARRR